MPNQGLNTIVSSCGTVLSADMRMSIGSQKTDNDCTEESDDRIDCSPPLHSE